MVMDRRLSSRKCPINGATQNARIGHEYEALQRTPMVLAIAGKDGEGWGRNTYHSMKKHLKRNKMAGK